jgi:hypothetical protein
MIVMTVAYTIDFLPLLVNCSGFYFSLIFSHSLHTIGIGIGSLVMLELLAFSFR